MSQFLVLLETAGNQGYIFATNKLRENVGASELTLRAGTEWVADAVQTVFGVRPVLPTSGKAYVLAANKDDARKVVSFVTRRALTDAPGLDLSGVIVPFETGLHDAIQKAHKELASRRGATPGPDARFRRLPVVAECATSGLPAAKYDNSRPEPNPRSAQSLAKRAAFDPGIRRMREIARDHGGRGIVRTVDDLDRFAERDWLAVVHADGNGLGNVFLHFHEHAKTTDDGDYAAKLKAFSDALDRCTHAAFRDSLEQLARRTDADPLPVVPIVLGGDDMTVVMDGKLAVPFTIDYLRAFEQITAADSLISKIMRGPDGKGPDRVTACAGVAVVKPHFPFHAGYELADALIRSAKNYAKGISREQPPSAVDFHVLYDASGADLNRIRRSLTVGHEKTKLVARPYLVADDKNNPRSTAALEARVRAVRAPGDDGRRAIPNSQLHDLRAALFLGRDAAEARLGLIRERYGAALAPLLVNDKLFWDGTEENKVVARTALLDAVDVADFWPTGEGDR